MLALHGGWVQAAASNPARFALWAERAATPRRRRPATAAGGPPRHPFAANADQLTAALGSLPGWDAATEGHPWEVLAWLPAGDGAPLPSPELSSAGAPASDGKPALAVWRLPALALEAAPAAQLLLALAAAPPVPGAVIGDDLRFWVAATRFALELVHRQRLLPALLQEDGKYAARWRPLLDDADRQRLGALAGAMPSACRALAQPPAETPPAGPRRLLEDYLRSLVDGVARSATPGTASRGAANASRRRAGGSRPSYALSPGGSVAEAWWNALFASSPVVDAAPEVLRAFQGQLGTWAQPGTSPAAADGAPAADTFRVCFRLEPPPPPEAAEAGVSSAAGGALGGAGSDWASGATSTRRDSK
jgi:hypothetical protein